MVFHIPSEDQTNSKHDQIAFGISANNPDGTILSVSSSISKDFVKLQLVNVLLMSINMLS